VAFQSRGIMAGWACAAIIPSCSGEGGVAVIPSVSGDGKAGGTATGFTDSAGGKPRATIGLAGGPPTIRGAGCDGGIA
jgi:hypothetical protein